MTARLAGSQGGCRPDGAGAVLSWFDGAVTVVELQPPWREDFGPEWTCRGHHPDGRPSRTARHRCSTIVRVQRARPWIARHSQPFCAPLRRGAAKRTVVIVAESALLGLLVRARDRLSDRLDLHAADAAPAGIAEALRWRRATMRLRRPTDSPTARLSGVEVTATNGIRRV